MSNKIAEIKWTKRENGHYAAYNRVNDHIEFNFDMFKIESQSEAVRLHANMYYDTEKTLVDIVSNFKMRLKDYFKMVRMKVELVDEIHAAHEEYGDSILFIAEGCCLRHTEYIAQTLIEEVLACPQSK